MLSKGELEILLGRSLDDDQRSRQYDAERNTPGFQGPKIPPFLFRSQMPFAEIVKLTQAAKMSPDTEEKGPRR